MSDKKLLEKTWENIQKKTFTGWVNSHLRKRNLVVSNLETDLSDGLKLISLLEIISDDIMPYKFEKKPRMRIQNVGNVNHALNFIKLKGVNLAGIGAEEIVDGNLKMILGMIWTIILRFQIQDISLEELSAKEALLLWCQKKTAGYAGVNVKNFHMSFQDGLAFCALIHKHRPDLIDWDGLDKSNKALCLQTAFDVAEKSLDIPKLLDPADLLDVAKPDERSIITYVSLYYHVFASSQKADAAGRRVGKVIDFAESNEKLQSDYNNKAKKLAAWITQTTEQLGDRTFDNTLEGVQRLIDEFKSFRANEKPPRYNEKVELEALLSGLQTKLALNGRPPYTPPAGLSSKDIDGLWAALGRAEQDRNLALRDELRRQKKISDLTRKFRQLAGKLEQWSAERETGLNSSDLGDTISQVNAKLKNLEAFESEYTAQNQRVDQLRGIAQQLQALNYNDQGTIDSRVSSIQTHFGTLNGLSAQRKQKLEERLAHLQHVENLLLEFAKRGLEFRVWLENADDTLTDPIVVESVEGIQEYQNAYNHFLTEKDAKNAEFSSLANLVNEIAKNGVAETTYSEVSWASLQKGWANVEGQINDRASALQSEHATQTAHEALRVDFATRANEFHSWTKSKADGIEGLSGDIQAQLDAIKTINHEINQGEDNFNALVNLTHQLDAAGVSDNQHTEHTIEGLKSQWDALNILSKKKEQVLEKELLAQAHSGISADQLKEFKECFVHFDKDEDNLLSRLELGACLKSLGEDINFDQGGKLDQILTAIDIDGDGKATFEEFVGYMERVSSGSDTPDSIKQAFRVLAGDKDYVTEADLRAVLPNEKVDYCLKHMQPYPGLSGAYDYNTFTDKLYGR